MDFEDKWVFAKGVSYKKAVFVRMSEIVSGQSGILQGNMG